MRDLGVLVYTWHLGHISHISDIVKKANRMLGMTKRCFKFMGKDIFVRLYKALAACVGICKLSMVPKFDKRQKANN